MSRYIFTFPSGTPPMTYESLRQYVNARDTGGWTRTAKIGSTVTITWMNPGSAIGYFGVLLYGALIARIYPDQIRFSDDDPHVATTYWIGRIVRDNGLGWQAGRIRRRKADGPGPVTPSGGQAGLLVIDYDRDKPVFGRAWPVGQQEVTAS